MTPSMTPFMLPPPHPILIHTIYRQCLYMIMNISVERGSLQTLRFTEHINLPMMFATSHPCLPHLSPLPTWCAPVCSRIACLFIFLIFLFSLFFVQCLPSFPTIFSRHSRQRSIILSKPFNWQQR